MSRRTPPTAKVDRNAEIVAYVRAGGRQVDAAERWGLTPQRVSQIVRRAEWRAPRARERRRAMRPTTGWLEWWSDRIGVTPLAERPHTASLAPEGPERALVGTDGFSMCVLDLGDGSTGAPDVPAMAPDREAAVRRVLGWAVAYPIAETNTTRAALRAWEPQPNREGHLNGTLGGVRIDAERLRLSLGYLPHGPVRVVAFDDPASVGTNVPIYGVCVYGDGWTVVVMGLAPHAVVTGAFEDAEATTGVV